VRNDTDPVKHVNKLLDLDEYRRETTLSEPLVKILRKTRLTLFGVAAGRKRYNDGILGRGGIQTTIEFEGIVV
jgi:hypothetical protein